MLIEKFRTSDRGRQVPVGAGLPKFEGWFSRYLMVPVATRLISPNQALNIFQAEGHLIIQICGMLTPEQMEKCVLIPRIRGIEESSRNWSPSMVLEHLMMMGSHIRDTVIELSGDRKPSMQPVNEALRPGGVEDAKSIILDYRAFVSDYVETLAKIPGIHYSTATHEHPWFGKLDAQKWIVLGALHQRIHRRQLEHIVSA